MMQNVNYIAVRHSQTIKKGKEILKIQMLLINLSEIGPFENIGPTYF